MVERPFVNSRVERMRSFMKSKGYNIYAKLRIDDFFVKSSASHQI